MNRLRLRAALLVLPALGLLAAGCGEEGEATAGDGAAKLEVVTTTNWHSDLAKQIGGDRVEVEGLMGPGVDPHLYQASAGDVDKLSGADVAIWNGLELEGKMEEVFAEVGEVVPVVTVGEAVPIEDRIEIADVVDEYDPHVWFDPENWADGAAAVAEGLSDADPEGAATYERNLAAFEDELERTDAYVRARVEKVPERSRVLVTSHDAFSYFADTYGFEVAPIQGKSTATEATTADVERVAETVAEADLGAVFIESSVPQQTIDAVLAAAEKRGQPTEVGGELFGDALGAPGSEDGDWAGAVRHNVDAIAAGLGR